MKGFIEKTCYSFTNHLTNKKKFNNKFTCVISSEQGPLLLYEAQKIQIHQTPWLIDSLFTLMHLSLDSTFTVSSINKKSSSNNNFRKFRFPPNLATSVSAVESQPPWHTWPCTWHSGIWEHFVWKMSDFLNVGTKVLYTLVGTRNWYAEHDLQGRNPSLG